MFFVLEMDLTAAVIGTLKDESNALINPFAVGDPVETSVIPVVKLETACEIYPDYFELQQVSVVSRRFKDAISGMGLKDVQFHPVRVLEGEREIQGYFILHVLKKIPALDEAQSIVTKLGKTIMRIKRLCLKPLATETEIFRL